MAPQKHLKLRTAFSPKVSGGDNPCVDESARIPKHFSYHAHPKRPRRVFKGQGRQCVLKTSRPLGAGGYDMRNMFGIQVDSCRSHQELSVKYSLGSMGPRRCPAKQEKAQDDSHMCYSYLVIIVGIVI